MRPFATFIAGVAGIAVWSMLVLMAGRSIGNEETTGFEIEDMPTEWADPAIAPDAVTDVQSGTATDETNPTGAMLDGSDVPPEGIALILGVDRPLDMARTVLNVTGDAVVCTSVARMEGAIGEG